MGCRELLKLATKLKQEKKYDEACQTLRVAYQSADVGEEILINERLRLPMYFLLAGQRDEGWYELNRLVGEYLSPIDQIAIRNQMRIFSEKEKRWNDAIFFSAWVYVLEIQRDIKFIISITDGSDMEEYRKQNGQPEYINYINNNGEHVKLDISNLFQSERRPYAYTNSGSPIYDCAYNFILKRLNQKLEIDVIEKHFSYLCKKISKEWLPPIITKKIIEIIEFYKPTDDWVTYLHNFLREELW
ncbi:hypothetical protein GZB59_003687 [Salmonella enterica]|nr:hypothetical protein [Salmonella enterica]